MWLAAGVRMYVLRSVKSHDDHLVSKGGIRNDETFWNTVKSCTLHILTKHLSSILPRQPER